MAVLIICLSPGGFIMCVCVCQISMKEHLEDSLLECTMQDLLRYDDYNNDGHLSLHEFYTAFRESLLRPCIFPPHPHPLPSENKDSKCWNPICIFVFPSDTNHAKYARVHLLVDLFL